MSESIDAVINRIRAYARQPGWSKSRLAKEAGLSINALSGLYDEGWSATLDTIRSVEAVIPPEWRPDEPADTTLKRSDTHSNH